MHFGQIQEALEGIGADTEEMGIHGGHTDMAVPICLYAPESVKETMLDNLSLPTTGNVRTGNSEYYVDNEDDSLTWYTSSALNANFVIDNSTIAPAIAKTVGLGSLDDATNMLFQPVGSLNDEDEFTGPFGGSIVYDEDTYIDTNYDLSCDLTFSNQDKSLQVDRNSTTHTYNGTVITNTMIGNHLPKSIYIQSEHFAPEYGTFYVPYEIFLKAGFGWSITVTCDSYGFDLVLLAKGTDSIVLPDSNDGKQITYTDGTTVYNPGDTIPYSGSNLALNAYVQ